MNTIKLHLVCALMIPLAACAAEAAQDNAEVNADALSEVTVHAADGHALTFLSSPDHTVAAFEITSPTQPSALRQHPGASMAEIFRAGAPDMPVPEFLLAAERDGAARASAPDHGPDVVASQAALTDDDYQQDGGCNECGWIGNLDSYPHSTEYCHMGFQGNATDGSVGQQFAGSFNSRDHSGIATVFLNGRQRQTPLEPNQMLTWRVTGAAPASGGGVAANNIFIKLQGESGATYDMGMCVAGYEDPSVVLGPQVTVGGP